MAEDLLHGSGVLLSINEYFIKYATKICRIRMCIIRDF